MGRRAIDNVEIAERLDRIADLLEIQHAGSFRIRAYRRASQELRAAPTPARDILRREGTEGLERLPGIGKSIASLIHELIETGGSRFLERLEGQVSPEDLFTTVPGIGEELAHRIHQELGVETLEELELAAHDGRLEAVPGFGHRRASAVRQSLASILSLPGRRRARKRLDIARNVPVTDGHRPSVEEILAVDAEYRAAAREGRLRTIAPRRFNPDRESWLPILHTERGDWSFTALYSNTFRAHQLGMTHDWVVIYYERDGDEDQCTVVTERAGSQAGQRVIRGREAECARYRATEKSPE